MQQNEIKYLSSPTEVSMSDDWFNINDLDNFWIRWRFEYIKRHFNPGVIDGVKALEIGCGNGINMQLFETDLGLVVDGCDLNETAVKQIKNVTGQKYIYNIYDLNHDMLEYYDLILLLDVIEHIKEDRDFVKKALKHLKVNGRIIVNVPAFNMLYSKYDSVLGHIKRYRKKELKLLLTSLGLEIEHISYWGFFLFPVLIIRKFALYFKRKNIVEYGFQPPHPIINTTFKIIMKIENKLFSKPILGSSILVIARKINN